MLTEMMATILTIMDSIEKQRTQPPYLLRTFITLNSMSIAPCNNHNHNQ